MEGLMGSPAQEAVEKSSSRASILAVALLFVLVLGSAVGLHAQSATTGALSGAVNGPQGAALPGATVALTNTATGQVQTTVTDSKGLFGFSLLPPGTYEVDFSARGFKTSQAMSVVVNVSE